MTKTVAQKLGLKPGATAQALYLPAGLEPLLADWPAPPGREPGGTADHVLAFVGSVADLAARAPAFLAAYREGGHLWVAYPKKSGAIRTDITRDHGWAPLADAGFLAVTQVALDDTWSALRFRREPEVKEITRRR